MAAHIIDPAGQVMLQGNVFDLKIDTNRRIYVRWHEGKHKSSKFVLTGHQIEQGYSAEEKQLFLANLQKKMLVRMKSDTPKDASESGSIDGSIEGQK